LAYFIINCDVLVPIFNWIIEYILAYFITHFDRRAIFALSYWYQDFLDAQAVIFIGIFFSTLLCYLPVCQKQSLVLSVCAAV
jgi:hypothetical protein